MTNPERNPAQILREVLPHTSSGVISHLPERHNLTKAMRHARKQCLPPNPKSLEELEELPESFKNTIAGDRFLLHDSRDARDIDGRVIVFGTRRNLELLATSKVWYLDGTFKVRIY